MSNANANTTYNKTQSSNSIAMAREKLQSSAREWIRNIEDAVMSSSSSSSTPLSAKANEDEKGNTTTTTTTTTAESLSPARAAASIEQAFRLMFGACTNSAEQAIAPTSSREQNTNTSATNATPNSQHRRASLAMPQQSSSSSSSSSEQQQLHRIRRASMPSRPKPPVVTPSPKQMRHSTSQRDLGEHIYAQLFHDDNHHIATQPTRAMDSAREMHAGRTTTPSPTVAVPKRTLSPHTSTILSKPFPMSSPPRVEPVPSQELHVPTACSFDDDTISAISAHTLEAMAQQEQQQQQTVVHRQQTPTKLLTTTATKTTITRTTITTTTSTPSSLPSPSSNPSSNLVLNRSRGSNSSGSKHSKGTRTTTTESSAGHNSFDAWQTTEQAYWKDVVATQQQQEEEDYNYYSPTTTTSPARSRKLILRSNSHGNNSSFHHRYRRHHHEQQQQQQQQHPHETPLDRRLLRKQRSASADPDRLKDVLVMDYDTEMAEI